MPQLLADHTTLRLGGPADRLVSCSDDAGLIAVVSAADDADEPVLVLGAGSNLVIADDGFRGLVVKVASSGVSVRVAEGGIVLSAAAGEPWDAVVATAISEGLAGLECLSGIPGLTGATPIQNVGAYGQEVADSIIAVRCYDRRAREVVTLPPSACGFGYRTSAFKRASHYVVLEVSFGLAHAASGLSRPIAYAELAASLGAAVGERAKLADVRAAVLELRRAKGMLLDPADPDPDAVSAGSFFTNPVVDAGRVPQGAPQWPTGDVGVKTSAAWLIERAGFGRGYGDGAVGISGKHTLALINRIDRGGGTTAELVALAREIRDGVSARFGITLAVEPTLVGVTLDK